MQVFKVYFKILKSVLPIMLIYLVIFIALAVGLSNLGGNNAAETFSPTKTNIAFINDDQNSPLTAGLKKYLSKDARIVPLADNLQSLQDALFYGQVDYIVRIPKGFTQSFLSGKNDVKLEKTTVPSSASSVNMDFLINKYLNTASLYEKNLPGITQPQLVSYIGSDLQTGADVQLQSYSRQEGTSNVTFYFTYFSYSMAAILILGVAAIMAIFNESELKKRNMCSPMKSLYMNMQLLLGNLAFAVAAWALMVGLGLIIYGKALLDAHFALLCINSLVLTFAWLSISFLVGNVIKSRNAQAAAANVLALGTSFIGGVFVPQALLGKTVQTIASFTPTYWYIKAVNNINDLVVGSADNLRPIIYSILIQLGFAVAVVAVTLVIIKQRRTKDA
jgi:ABC-2 type transport system permease protein